MTNRLSHAALRELLAPYALDAVDGDEAELVELHLRECPRCRAEVTDYREVAGALATGHEPAPVKLWDNLVAELEAEPPMQLASVLPLRRTPAPLRRSLTAMFAVAATVIALLGVRVVQQDHRIDGMQAAMQDRTLLAAALAAHEDPNARTTELRSKSGVVLASRGARARRDRIPLE